MCFDFRQARTLIALATALAARGAVVVAVDGSGDYRSVQNAVDAAPSHSQRRFVIHIKPGVYKEHIVVPHSKPFLTFEGEDARSTILTGDWYAAMPDRAGKPLGTFRTPTTTIEADDFTALNITFENSAGQTGQAVALAILGDRAIFRNCRFLGWQDTLLAQWGRQYFENAYVEGAVDFIFGGATAFFDHCHIHASGSGYITAASTPRDQPYGFVFSQCRITGALGVKTDLGRPWRDQAAVVFLNTEMGEVVRLPGWNNWGRQEREKTARYAEHNSTGPGANPQARVAWARLLLEPEARAITPKTVLGGRDGWDPLAGTARTRLVIDSRPPRTKMPQGKAYLAVAAREGEPALHLLHSLDGYTWMPSSSSPFPGSRDAAIAAGPGDSIHLVWAAGDRGLGISTSSDLIHWSAPRHLDAMASQNAIAVEHPSVFWDSDKREYVVLWASTLRDNFFQSYQEDVEDNPRLWYATTRDFENFGPAKLLFDPNYSVRDAALLRDGSRFVLLHQDSRRSVQQLRVSCGASADGPWSAAADSFPQTLARRPYAFRRDAGWLIYYDSAAGLGALETRDFTTFDNVTTSLHAPSGEHFISITEASLTAIGAH